MDGILTGANLSGAVLRRVTLSLVDLSGANLSGADLADTRFDSANLKGANLTGAKNINPAHLAGATMDSTTICVSGRPYSPAEGGASCAR